MISTRVVTDGGTLIVETDRGTTEEIRAVVREVWDALSPRRRSCGEVHPQQDVYHPDGHSDNILISLGVIEPVKPRST